MLLLTWFGNSCWFAILAPSARQRVTWTEGSSFPGLRIFSLLLGLLGLKVPVYPSL